MCGLCFSSAGRPTDVAGVEAVLAPRGPDGRGEAVSSAGWMLHRRLAIIDPGAGSAQPFEQGNGHVAYTGEIYNYRDLQGGLDHRRTSGDTEVFSQRLIAGAGIGDLRGMYAGVSMSPDHRTVRLTRDRFGIKPLYRRNDEHGLQVASQLRCFRHLPGELTIDDRAIASYLRFGSVQGCTMYREVSEVEPGTTETWVDGQLSRVDRLPPIEPGGDLRDALMASMERHLVADVEIAVLLSAGLDSSTLAFLAKECGANPVAVTIAALDGRDESDEAARTAKELGLRHEIIPVSEAEALACLDEFFESMDQPTIDGLNTFLVTRAVRQLGIPVALSGLGADELFGGYASFKRVWMTHRLRHLPRALLKPMVLRKGANPTKVDRWLDARHDPAKLATITREVMSPDEVRKAGYEPWTPPLPAADAMEPVMATELWRYMSPTLLRDGDAFSMANSVELRVPFLDEQVVAAAMARSPKQRATEGKRAIVEALGSPLLERVAARAKTGFELPLDKWADEGWPQLALDHWTSETQYQPTLSSYRKQP